MGSLSEQEPTTMKISQNLSTGITALNISGYKSIANDSTLEIRPLTIMAGANSSGKSSFFQPVLLMKQTIEESYDPGALLLNGPNVRLTSAEQVLYKNRGKIYSDTFQVGIEVGRKDKIMTHFKQRPNNKGFSIARVEYRFQDNEAALSPNQTSDEIAESIKPISPETISMYELLMSNHSTNDASNNSVEFTLRRERCFFKVNLKTNNRSTFGVGLSDVFEEEIRSILHIPGLRGNPERNYPATGINEGSSCPGTFEKYVASIITHWQESNDFDKLKKLGQYLKDLGLTSRATAQLRNDTEVELFVGRLLDSDGSDDLVSIADVGFGVSQTLPVIVALLFATRGQLVYIEQPELHLHPKAQYNLARILSEAASRGVKVVVETHSSLLLRAVQTLVAEGKLQKELVKLHWFTREQENGVTEVTSAVLDEYGAFGEWPEDFDDIEMMAEAHYLDAAELRGGTQSEEV